MGLPKGIGHTSIAATKQGPLSEQIKRGHTAPNEPDCDRIKPLANHTGA